MISINKRCASSIAGGIALMCFLLLAPVSSMAADNGNQSDNSKKPQYTFAMITHGQPGDAFWNDVRTGAELAASKYDNVEFIYLDSPNAAKMAQLVRNAIIQGADGIALTLAFPQAMKSVVNRAQEAGIPIIGFNAGFRVWKDLGLLMYVGQDEVLAGKAVGRKLNETDADTVVCLNQQQGAVQLAARCSGIKKTFEGKVIVLYTEGYNMSTARARMVAKLGQNSSIDYIVPLGAPFAPVALQAIQRAGSDAKVATFDLSARVVDLIKQGKVEFAVSQQPILQGYEAIDLLYRYKAMGSVLGGGDAVLTGPTIITQENIDERVRKGVY